MVMIAGMVGNPPYQLNAGDGMVYRTSSEIIELQKKLRDKYSDGSELLTSIHLKQQGSNRVSKTSQELASSVWKWINETRGFLDTKSPTPWLYKLQFDYNAQFKHSIPAKTEQDILGFSANELKTYLSNLLQILWKLENYKQIAIKSELIDFQSLLKPVLSVQFVSIADRSDEIDDDVASLRNKLQQFSNELKSIAHNVSAFIESQPTRAALQIMPYIEKLLKVASNAESSGAFPTDNTDIADAANSDAGSIYLIDHEAQRRVLLIKLHTYHEKYHFFKYVYQNPNRDIQWKEIEQIIQQRAIFFERESRRERTKKKKSKRQKMAKQKLNVNDNFTLVKDLRFTGDLKNLFFPSISKNGLYFRNPITRYHIYKLKNLPVNGARRLIEQLERGQQI